MTFIDHTARALLAAVGALVLGSCAVDRTLDTNANSAAASGDSAASPDIFYASQEEADADLARFDRENPQCQLWTNWQKMCSRTGPEGETICVNDEDKLVRPSVPFCSRRSSPIAGQPFSNHPDEQEKLVEALLARQSRNRFCVVYHSDDPSFPSFASIEGRNFEEFQAIPFCVEFATNRPFNGVRGYLANHPSCEQWSNFGHGLWHCVKPKEPSACQRLTIGAPVPSPTSTGISVGVNIFAEGEPIWGLYCDQRE